MAMRTHKILKNELRILSFVEHLFLLQSKVFFFSLLCGS